MSIKLYNGFKLNQLTFNEANEFYLKLRNMCETYAHDKYMGLFLSEITENIDTLCYFNKLIKDKAENASPEKFLNYLYVSSIPLTTMNRYMNNQISTAESVNTIINKNLSMLTCDIISNKMDKCDITNEVDYLYNYDYSIAMLPGKDKILLLVYGDELCNELTRIVNEKDKSCNELVNKYGLSEYKYWNNVDIPENISKKEWEMRGKEWTEVLDIGHGIPAKAGLSIDLYSRKYDLGFIFARENAKDYFDIINSKEERARHRAKEILFDDYVNKKLIEQGKDPKNLGMHDLPYSSIRKMEKEFNTLLKEDSTIINSFNELSAELADAFIDIDENIFKLNVKELIPEYIKTLDIKKEDVER